MSEISELDTVVLEALGLPGDTDMSGLAYEDTPEWDSVGHLQLMAAIEGHFGIAIEPHDVAAMTDLKSMRRLLAGKYGIEAAR